MVRVLVVDDSLTARRAISGALSVAPGIEVMGTAPDAATAEAMITASRPDVVTLDVEMPGMDGITFLSQLMQRSPLPVVIISSLTRRGSEMAMRALECGAVDVLCKPTAAEIEQFAEALVRSVRAAASARVGLARSPAPAPRSQAPLTVPPRPTTAGRVLAIGASTGGTEAIREVLTKLPADSPATLIVQHLPPVFTHSFAQRLDQCCAMRVAEARGGEEPSQGMAYVAPGGHHLLLTANREGRMRLELGDGPQEHFQRPAVDVLFRSVASVAGARAVGVLLTGMGQDGAKGLLEMRRAGARTLAQDEASCVVYGMPRAAVECGAVERGLPLDQIPGHILNAFTRLNAAADGGRDAANHRHRI